ncbi:MAG: hypothetical protein KBT67_00780 [bacterium]|nr:hypothetical protein [Candidatus Limimorpha caballi]
MKQYIKWFAKLLLLALILVIVDFGVGKLANYVFRIDNMTNPGYISRVTSCNDDIIIIGSSTANHHYISRQIQDSIGMNVYNAGLDGAFFIFQNCVINYLLEYNQPKYILWEIGEDCLSDNMVNGSEYQLVNLLYPYYNDDYIHRAIDDLDDWQWLRMKSNIFCDNSNMIHDVLTVFTRIHKGYPKTSMLNEDINQGYKPLPNTGYEYPLLKSDSVAEYINFQKVEMFRNTINQCKNKGVRIIITSSPRHYDAVLLSSKQACELRRIAKEENVPYMNFYNYHPISNQNYYFKDCDHLNSNGAEAYMEVFIPELKRVLVNY